MEKIIIKLVADDSIEDVLQFESPEEADKKESEIGEFLDHKKYYMERVKVN